MARAVVYDPPSAVGTDELRAQADPIIQGIPPTELGSHLLFTLARDPEGLKLLDEPRSLLDDAASSARAGTPLPPGATTLAGTVAAAPTDSRDGFVDKIAKYVPAESVTITTLAFAAFTPSGSSVWLWVAGGALANVLYLYGGALQAQPATKKPRWYFYPLAAAALVLWAIAVIGPVARQAGITGSNADTQKTFVLAAAAFVIPVLDTIATGLTDQRRAKKAAAAEGQRNEGESR